MEPITVHSETDTAHPQAYVPIYLIHSLQQPFCQKPGCWCQIHKACMVPLFAALKTGDLTVSEATAFVETDER